MKKLEEFKKALEDELEPNDYNILELEAFLETNDLKDFIPINCKEYIDNYTKVYEKYSEFLPSFEEILQKQNGFYILQNLLKIPFAIYYGNEHDISPAMVISSNKEALEDWFESSIIKSKRGYIDFEPAGFFETIKKQENEIAIISNDRFLELSCKIKNNKEELSKIDSYFRNLSRSYDNSECDLSFSFTQLCDIYKNYERREKPDRGYTIQHYASINDDMTLLEYKTFRETFQLSLEKTEENELYINFKLKNIKNNVKKLTVFKHYLQLCTFYPNIKCKNILYLNNHTSDDLLACLVSND